MQTPSTTGSDFDSSFAAANRSSGRIPLHLLGVLAALCLLFAGLFASHAGASKGIVGSFGTEETPGLSGPNGIAVNNTGAGGVPAGTVYVVGSRQVDRFDPNLQWVSRWGWNVTGINEQQRITIGASGGTFTLTVNGQTTKAIAFNATGTTAASAVGELPSIGAANVTGTNNSGPPAVITLTFTGTLSGTDIPQITANGTGLEGSDPVTGGSPTISTETLVQGAGGNFIGYEVCTVATLCAPGGSPASAAQATNGAFSPSFDGARSIAVDQGTGAVYATDRAYNRVQKFDAVGNALLVFGKNVNATLAPTGTEVCTVASGNVCQGGAEGSLGGEFKRPGVGQGNGIAVVPEGLSNSHNVIVSDAANGRIQEFSSEGAFVRAFGWDVIPRTKAGNEPNNEVQQVTIPGTDGTFTLKFGANTTAGIAYNASAATVQTALNGLSSISTGGGSVTVSGGPGDATGSTPYVVTFSGGPRSDADVAQLEVNGRGLGQAQGRTLTCGGPTAGSTTYQWLRNGAPIGGATAKTYVVQAADAGTAIQCQVYASNENEAAGRAMAQATNPPINASPLPASPRPVPPATLPFLTATFKPGQTNSIGADGGYELHCTPGTWQNSPTSFSYQWYRSGVPLSGHGANTADYTVQPQDLKGPTWFQCGVTGTNASGGVTMMTTKNGSFGVEAVSLTSSAPSAAPASTQIVDPATVATTVTGAKFEVCTVAADCQAAVTGTTVGQFASNSPARIAVDSTGATYATDTNGVNSRVEKISPQVGPPVLAPSVFGTDVPDPPGAPNSHTSNFTIVALAMGASGHLLAQKEYAAGFTPACPDGTASLRERRIQELASDGSSILDTHGVCSGISLSGSTQGLGYNAVTGDIYLVGDNNTVYILNGGAGTEPTVSIDDPVPTATNALVSGQVNPNPTPSTYPHPPKTSWQLQFKESSASNWTKFRTPTDVGAGSGNVPYRTTLTPLLPNTSYDVRVVATKQFNSSQGISSVKTFTTSKAKPLILSARSRHVSLTDADLEASINPRGSDTSYFFEWGTTPNYGNVTPVTGIGSGQGGQFVADHISGLSDVTYHFRVVAENEAGTVVGPDQSFTFHPPQCPNALVRQQTGAGYLPDCRAFELVSHSEAGNSVIDSFTGPHSPYATSPSRLAYMAMFAPLPEQGNPPNNFDLYVATRTNEGWVSKFIGLDATEAFVFGAPPGPTGSSGYITGYSNVIPVDPKMDKILMWDLGNPEILPPSFSNAPYVFGADGNVLERWPTNLSEIAGGEDFTAQNYQLLTSGDLTHFYFVSDVPFLPGAPATAIYDNDIEAGTLTIASKDPGEADFTGYPIEASTDGSHLLMSTATLPTCLKVPCAAIPPAHLYMRVDGVHTYDVTGGYNGTYAGMNSDGSRVFFTSTEAVTPGETDTSMDLYMWEEATDSITRVSAGTGGTGDTDACNAVAGWTSKCSIKLIRTYQQKCGGSGIPDNCDTSNPKPQLYNGDFNFKLAAPNGHPGDDTAVAAAGEEIYFYSPEKLDGPNKGAEGMPNLYVLNEGHAQFVATFNPDPACRADTGSLSSGTYCAAGPIGRIQVTPDGGYMAFTTHDELTGYHSNGLEEMYRYSPGDDDLICVSCLPDGSSPTSSVDGSQNGLFLTEDGRTFFTTDDAVQPDDTNKAQDVYEYVGGRPQLITGGTGSTRVPLCTQCGLGQFSRPGLIGVSADGLDVYFGTYDVITPQDNNGRNLKIYDARAGGGFANVAIPQPCQAADECHAPASQPDSDAPAATGTNLGGNGNFSDEAQKRKAKRAHKRHKRQKRHRQRKAHQRNAAGHHRNTGRNHG